MPNGLVVTAGYRIVIAGRSPSWPSAGILTRGSPRALLRQTTASFAPANTRGDGRDKPGHDGNRTFTRPLSPRVRRTTYADARTALRRCVRATPRHPAC